MKIVYNIYVERIFIVNKKSNFCKILYLHTFNWYFILLQYEIFFFLIVSIPYNEINKIEFQPKQNSNILFPFRVECFIQAI